MLRSAETPLPAYAGVAPYAFVSYARNDSDLVYPEIRRLQEEGYRIWYDRAGVGLGERWDDQIMKRLGACHCFLLFITRSAACSDYVRREIKLALARGVRFIRIDLEMVELDDTLQSQINEFQALDRYRVHRSEYERQLCGALTSSGVRDDGVMNALSSRDEVPVRSDEEVASQLAYTMRTLNLIQFSLILAAAVAFLASIVAVIIPLLESPGAYGPLDNVWAGFLTGFVGITVSIFFGVLGWKARRAYREGVK